MTNETMTPEQKMSIARSCIQRKIAEYGIEEVLAEMLARLIDMETETTNA